MTRRLDFRLFLLLFFLTVFSHSSSAESLSLREVRVAVAVSPGFQSLPNWKSDFERRLTYASRIFESEFKIKFRIVRYSKWTPNDETAEMTTLLEELRSDAPLVDSDIMIGLTHFAVAPDQPNMRDLHTLGQARPFTGHLVIRYPANKLYKVQEDTVLVHELGHVFGAVHTQDPNSIMSPIVDRQLPSRFDSHNRQIILETRALNLMQGAESLPEDTLKGLLRSYLKMIEKNDSADFFYSIGLFYLKLGQPENAIRAWKKAVGLAPENSEMRYNLGALYVQSGDVKRAIAELSHAVSGLEHPSQRSMKFSALSMLGEAYFAQENMFAAASAWQRALALKPDALDLQVNMAVVTFKQGQVDNAIQAFEKILVKDPQNLKALTYLGRGLAQKGKASDALQYFELALTQLNRQTSSAAQRFHLSSLHGEIGSILLKQNQQKTAFEHFQAACDLVPSVECHRKMGTLLLNSGQWDAAATQLAKIIEVQKEDADLYGMLGTALAQKGDSRNAISIFYEGLRYAKDPAMQARLHRNIANLYLSAGQYEMAEPEFRFALSKDWRDLDSHFGLAASLLAKNQPTGALDSLKNVLRIDPKNKRAQEMSDSIQASLAQAG